MYILFLKNNIGFIVFYINLGVSGLFSEGGFGGNVGSDVTGILGVGSIGSSGNVGVIENLVSGEIVNLVLHSGVEVGNFVDEHLDNLVEEGIFLVSSGLFSSPSFSLGVKLVNGVVKSRGRFEVNLPSFVFMSLGGDDGDQELVLISDLGSLFHIEVLKFLFGVL